MKFIIATTFFLTILIGFSFTIIAFYTDSMPYLYSGGYFYLVSSGILIILSLLHSKYSFIGWVNIFLNSLYILYGLSALIFALISLYNMPLGYLNALSSTMFIISMLIIYFGIILLNRKIKFKNYMSLFWIPFIISMLFTGALYALIQVYNSPDTISHVIYGSIIYFLTTIVLAIFTFFVSLHSNKIILYNTIFCSVLFLWIGIKIAYPLLYCTSYDINIFILGVSILIIVFTISQNIKKILT